MKRIAPKLRVHATTPIVPRLIGAPIGLPVPAPARFDDPLTA